MDLEVIKKESHYTVEKIGEATLRRTYVGTPSPNCLSNRYFKYYNAYKLLLGLQQDWHPQRNLTCPKFQMSLRNRLNPHCHAKPLLGIFSIEQIQKFILQFPRVHSIHEEYDGKAIIELDYVPGFSLEKKNISGLTLDTKCEIVFHIAAQLKILHSFQLYHSDVKPHNIIWNPDARTATLIDFDFLDFFGPKKLDQETKIKGSPNYLCPEVLKNQVLDEERDAIDLYAFAVFIFVLFTEDDPYGIRNPTELYKIIKLRTPHLERLRTILAPDFPEFVNLDSYYAITDLFHTHASPLLSMFVAVLELFHRSQPSKRRLGLDRILETNRV